MIGDGISTINLDRLPRNDGEICRWHQDFEDEGGAGELVFVGAVAAGFEDGVVGKGDGEMRFKPQRQED